MTRMERLACKFLLVAFPVLAVWCFCINQAGHWEDVKAAKAKAHNAMIAERDKALAEALAGDDVKPVYLWRDKPLIKAVYKVKKQYSDIERARVIADVWGIKGDGNIKQLTQILKQ